VTSQSQFNYASARTLTRSPNRVRQSPQQGANIHGWNVNAINSLQVTGQSPSYLMHCVHFWWALYVFKGFLYEEEQVLTFGESDRAV